MLEAHQEGDQGLARQLWALGDIVRLRMIRLLPTKADCSSGYNVTRLAQEMGLAQPTVSHHLRMLKVAGVVECTKHCRDAYYYLNKEACAELLEDVRELLELPVAGEILPEPLAVEESPALEMVES
jgi:ArsR family transcriptional regulator, arsenate/arsenite/antimonite-responsive transcriptional repressor